MACSRPRQVARIAEVPREERERCWSAPLRQCSVACANKRLSA